MDPIARILGGRSPGAARLRGLLKKAMRARVRPTALHRLLAAERSARLHLGGELSRILYYQPLFELLCEAVGDGCRVEPCPDSKVPFVYNCRVRLGERVRLSGRTTLAGARNAPDKALIELGDDTYLGHRVVLRAGTGIRLGRHVTVASNVILCGDPGHPLDPVARRTEPAPASDLGFIEVGDDAWIAEGATVLGNVRIGEGAVVAAHAVVTKDVPARTIVGGNPARVLRAIGPESAAESQGLQAVG